MKKIVSIVTFVLFFITFFWIYNKNEYSLNSEAAGTLTSQQSIAQKLIRFHVLANSDSCEDQALKLKIRDKVLEYIAPKMASCKSVEESKIVLKENNEIIRKVAEKVVNDNGYNYSIKTELNKVQFPVKSYGTIILPEGEYEAYRILIGSAKGHNWWCVMFPPLCFTDITKGEVEVKKTQKEMRQALTKDEYALVDNSKQESQSKNITVKFKIVEEAQKLFKTVQNKISHKG